MSKRLTITEVSERYGVGRRVVESWIESRALDATNVSASGSKYKRWRISERALQRFEASRSPAKKTRPQPMPTMCDGLLTTEFGG